jgi:hypothetical protein
MKTYLLLAVIAVTSLSCTPTASFNSPNDITYITGTIYLSNGNTVEGKLSVDDWSGYVRVYLQGERKPQRYKLSEVDGYKIRNEYYELKEIKDGGALSRKYRFHFMKRLTPDNSKLQLYEFLDKETYNAGYRRPRTVTTLEKSYYIQLPSEKEDGVWDISQAKFVPNFDEKMSKIVNDCPGLSQKIANKDKGYFYPQFGGSEENRVDMLWKIINEYNKCN